MKLKEREVLLKPIVIREGWPIEVHCPNRVKEQMTSIFSFNVDPVMATIMLAAVLLKLAGDFTRLPPCARLQLHRVIRSHFAVAPNALDQAPVPLFQTIHHTSHGIEFFSLVVATADFDRAYFQECGRRRRDLVTMTMVIQVCFGLDCGISESGDGRGSHQKELSTGSFYT